jgi:tetratricopeptide (TPR) repeat protein
LAIPLFERAVELDPRYARAYALLAHSYIWNALFIDLPNAASWIAKAESAAGTAEQLSSNLAEPHLARAELLFSAHSGWRIDDAIRELQTAVSLNPHTGHSDLGSLFAHLGLRELSQQHIERALIIDPLSTTNKMRYVSTAVLTGDYEASITANRRLFNRDGPADALLAVGRLHVARPLIEEALRTASSPRLFADKALLLAMEGRFREAEQLIPRIVEGRLDRSYHHAALSLAGVFALQGKTADAIKWLRICSGTGMPNYLLFSRDPALDRIRSHPDFQQFLMETKKVWDDYRRRYS